MLTLLPLAFRISVLQGTWSSTLSIQSSQSFTLCLWGPQHIERLNLCLQDPESFRILNVFVSQPLGPFSPLWLAFIALTFFTLSTLELSVHSVLGCLVCVLYPLRFLVSLALKRTPSGSYSFLYCIAVEDGVCCALTCQRKPGWCPRASASHPVLSPASHGCSSVRGTECTLSSGWFQTAQCLYGNIISDSHSVML